MKKNDKIRKIIIYSLAVIFLMGSFQVRVPSRNSLLVLSEDETVEAKLVLYDANNNVIDQTLLANNLGKEGVSVEVELLQVKSVPIEVDTSDVSAAEGYKLG